MAYELGKAYIQIVPTTKGMGKDIEDELSGVGARAGATKGGGLGGKMWGGLKAGAVGAGVAIGGVLAGSVAKGFKRLSSIEQAEAKLAGLGHSAESVQAIMENALASVKGTSFGLDEAAGLAGTLVASGVKPGEELERILSLTADSATIAGRELGDMGLIWGSVAAKGKLQGDDAMQLLASGVPIWQMVGDVMGITAAEAQKLGTEGEVSFDIFAKAMEQGVGGAALEAGNTTQGAFKNMGAAMGRFGAALLKDVYPYIGPLLGRITDLFDYLTDQAGPAVERVMDKVVPLGKGLKGIWDILVNGDYTGAENLFGFEEDSGFVDFLFNLRDGAIELYERALVPLYEKALKPFAEWWLREAPSFLPVIGKVVAAIGAVVAVLAGAGLAAVVASFMGTIAFAVGVVWPILTAVVNFVQETLWPVLKKVFDAVANAIVQVWQGVVVPAFQQFMEYLQGTVMPIVQRLWTDYIQPAFQAIGAAAVWLWENAIKPAFWAIVGFVRDDLGPALTAFWENVVSPVFAWIGEAIKWAFENVVFPALDMFKYFLTEILPPALEWLWETVKTVWGAIRDTIKAVVDWFQTWVWPVISLVIELIKLGFNTLRDALKAAWGFIRDNVINPVIAWFRDTAWPILDTVLGSIKTGFNVMRDALKNAWDFIKDNIIAPVANWFRDTIAPLFDDTTQQVGGAFDTMKDAIGKAWEEVKNTAKAPIKFVVETVVNDALIGNFNKVAKKLGTPELPSVSLPSGFARGGVLPGMSRMRDGDDQLVPMRRGEGVLVSEGLRTPRDRSAFLAANAAGRRGIGFADWMQGGFARGGILGDAWRGVKDLAGDALDLVLEGVDFVTEAIADPKAMFAKVYDAVVGQFPVAGLFGDMAKGAAGKIRDGVVDSILGVFGPGSDAHVGPAPAGSSRSLGYAQQMARSFGLSMTSFRRPGARTAGSGSVSLHAQGRAMDFSNGGSPTPQMMAFFNAMHPLKPTELLYSPAGARQWRRGGYMADTSGATKRNHYNHVHVGFAQGGILPFLHDRGGWHEPGSLSVNQTRKPEAVLTNGQWATMARLADKAAGGIDGATVSLSETDRALLEAIAKAADLKVDGRSVVDVVRSSFKGARMPLVTSRGGV